MFKKIMIFIVVGILVLGILFLYIRWFEHTNMFFPSKMTSSTPEEAGLSYKNVYLCTQDNIKINGWFIPSGLNRATILYCHGNAGNISDRVEIIKMFNELGLNVFIFDYRGYGKSSGVPSEKGTYLDAIAAYDYLVKEQGVTPDRIVIFGRSLGGAIAIDLATKKEARAVITDSTFTSTYNIANELYPFLPVKYFISMKYDSIDKIGGLNIPKLLIHRRWDEVIPFEHGEQLFEKASEPKEFYIVNKGRHNDSHLEGDGQYIVRIDEFLKKQGL